MHLAGALLSSALWVIAGQGWSSLVDRLGGGLGVGELFARQRLLLFTLGVPLYLLAAAVHHAVAASQQARRAERRTLELRLLAREAELEAFKAQIDPHFLFNCLNSISALAGSDPAAARRMAIQLASFLRATVDLTAQTSIPLADELDLVTTYLDIERVRFGDRLRYERETAPDCLPLAVPALLLQPLVENALKHGIAARLEGGTVRISATRHGGRLLLAIDNPCDAQRPATPRRGIGLANVRGRLELLHGAAARLSVHQQPGRFRVEIELPADAPADVGAPRPALAAGAV